MDAKPFLFLIWCMVIVGFQVMLFLNGFLLTRVTHLQNSTCRQHSLCTGEKTCNLSIALQVAHDAHEIQQQVCFQHNNRVILLIIDAFRYDFAVFNDSIAAPMHFQNKLKIIDEKLKREPHNARLHKFVADPPTTTMQRLKALTTGTLPTFIDAGSNFATHEINEDNLLDQMMKSNKRVIFMGDDTWEALYPKRFLRSYPYPSFNVWDLDTVDSGILSHLYKELQTADWSLLVAHFLGVDHCGHRYGPNHPEMERKLLQMNEVITNITKSMSENVVLYVIGDHGMTSSGDHGGESENELNAALFSYSKTSFASARSTINVVKQVDIVPTLATLLGIAIPFSNLGSLIHNCMPLHQHAHLTSVISAWTNAQQLMTYIHAYAASSNLFSDDKLRNITQTFDGLKQQYENLMARFDEKNWREFIGNVHYFIQFTRESCEQIWIQFDEFSMARGLLLVSTLTIFIYLIVNGLERPENVVTKQILLVCYSSIVFSAIFALICEVWTNAMFFSSGLFALIITASLVIQNFDEISSKLHKMSKTRNFSDLILRLLLVFSGLMLFSNSFILEESKVMLFYLLTLIFIQLSLYILAKLRQTNKSLAKILKSKTLLVMLIVCTLLRLSMNFWRCREEQGCNNSIFLSAKSVAGRSEWLLATFTSIAFVVFAKMWLRSCGNLNGWSFTVLLAKFAPISAIVCIAGFWILHSLTRNEWMKLVGGENHFQPDFLAWIAYALIAATISTIFVQPLCVYHDDKRGKLKEIQGDDIIPQLARHLFIGRSSTKETPVVYGLATVYSAAFIIILMNVILIWLLILDFAVVPSCIALIAVCILSLLINAILKFEQATSVDSLLSVPKSSLLIWFFMSVYMFYGTGHQPAFPNIAWEAAFVGTMGAEGKFVHNFIPATLVIINTFGSFLVMGVSLPLLVITPFTVYVMAPNFIGKRGKFVLHRGELEILDHQNKVKSVLFKLSFDYVLCHILRIFCIMLSSTIHCRHLMVWNVFAPKLIFEAIGLFITMLSVCIGLALFMRINSTLDGFLTKLTKQTC